jgi:hypothetical protein
MFMPQTQSQCHDSPKRSAGFRVQGLRQRTSPSRRFTSRVEVPEDTCVYWRCDGRDDLSHVQNISLGGLFIETPRRTAKGAAVSLSFLVWEGQIRADADVRHALPGTGIGLKFRAVREEDRPYPAASMTDSCIAPTVKRIVGGRTNCPAIPDAIRNASDTSSFPGRFLPSGTASSLWNGFNRF